MDSSAVLPKARFAYLDWLRFLVVLSLAPFHAAISFTGMGSVPVYDTPVRDLLLAGARPVNMGPAAMSAFTVFMDNWFMNLLFLLSGIGAALSLRKRTGLQFLLERCNRLLLPLLIFTPLLISFQTWLGALSFGAFSGGFFAFFPHFFTGCYLNYGHLWFLAYLFVYSALALPWFLAMKRKGEASRSLSLARRFAGMPMLLLPALWTGLLEAVFRPGWPGYMNLVNDWAVFTLNLSFFLGGYLLGSLPELLAAIERYRLSTLILGCATYFARMATYRLVAVPEGYNAANILAQAFRGLASYWLVLAALGYGQRYLNRQGRFIGMARDLSFPLYILHYAPLTAASYLLLDSGLSIWTRWILIVAASWGFVALFTYLARPLPVLGSFFGIRKRGEKVSGKARVNTSA